MADSTLLKTPLFDWHQSHGGRMVEFGGWLMPVQYSTIIDEHRAVRQRVGIFDISHMGRLTFDGPDMLDWIQRVTTNDAARLDLNQIQSSRVGQWSVAERSPPSGNRFGGLLQQRHDPITRYPCYSVFHVAYSSFLFHC